MKKLFMMILLLVVTLPALAVEKKLVCAINLKNGENTFDRIIKYDPDEKTIQGWADGKDGWHINDDEMGRRETFIISRINGEFWGLGQYGKEHGYCVPYKQAF